MNTAFALPSADTIGNMALVDAYIVLKQKVLDLLSSCFSGMLMMDGWTDKYKANPYSAIHISIVDEWQLKVSGESHIQHKL